MNEKLIEFIIELYKYEEFKDLQYSLTINYDRKVPDFRTEEFNSQSLLKIKNIISDQKVTSFNFTLYDKKPSIFNFDYKGYWYDLNYVFHGQRVIKCDIYFSAFGLSLNQLPEKIKLRENDVYKLLNIASFYKKTSEELYKMFN